MTDAAMMTVVYLTMVGFILLLPYLSRGDVLFGVRFAPGVRHSEIGLRHLRIYRLQVLALAALAAVPLLAWHDYRAVPRSFFAVAVLFFVVFYSHWRSLRRLAPDALPVREAALSEPQENMSPWFWLLLPAALILAAAAVYLRLHWESIPPIVPVHWNVHNQPDDWALKSIRSVYGPLLVGLVMTLWTALMGMAILYGSRRTDLRPRLVVMLLVCANAIALLFSCIALMPLLRVTAWLMPGLPLLLIVGSLAWVLWALRRTRTPSEPTPNECWYGGMIYYNPQDPAIFVEKRVGIGYTMNFANPLGWLLVGGIILVVVVIGRVIGHPGA